MFYQSAIVVSIAYLLYLVFSMRFELPEISPAFYPLLMLGSQMLQSMLMRLYDLCVFIITSTFITWYHLTPTTNDTRRHDTHHDTIWLKHYLATEYSNSNIFTLTTGIETASSNRVYWFDILKDPKYIQLRQIPGTSYSVFWYQSKLILYTGSSLMTYTWLVNRNQIWYDLFSELQLRYTNDRMTRQMHYHIFTDGGHVYIREPMIQEKRTLDDRSYCVMPDMLPIVSQVASFMDPSAMDSAKQFKLTSAMRICTYGPPGSGKTELAFRLAGEHNLPLYSLNAEGMTDSALLSVHELIPYGVLLIDEFDKCVYELNMVEKVSKNMPSLTAWHKFLDTATNNRVIVYMTTNNYDKILGLNHGSLVRNERVDLVTEIGPLTEESIMMLMTRHYDTPVKLDKPLFMVGGRTLITPADVIHAIKQGDVNAAMANLMITDQKLSLARRIQEKSKGAPRIL